MALVRPKIKFSSQRTLFKQAQRISICVCVFFLNLQNDVDFFFFVDCKSYFEMFQMQTAKQSDLFPTSRVGIRIFAHRDHLTEEEEEEENLSNTLQTEKSHLTHFVPASYL